VGGRPGLRCRPDGGAHPLAVLGVTALLAFDPGRVGTPEWEYDPVDIDITAALAHGGRDDDTAIEDGRDRETEVHLDEPGMIERAPWL
jgi:hypothetical protein